MTICCAQWCRNECQSTKSAARDTGTTVAVMVAPMNEERCDGTGRIGEFDCAGCCDCEEGAIKPYLDIDDPLEERNDDDARDY